MKTISSLSTLAMTTAALAVSFLATGGLASAQDYPTDEAALYEAAKAEGTVVWYISAPLEPMKAIALEFEKKYPGVKVEVLRYPSVQQYQKFMEEVSAEQYNVDVMAMSDQPSMNSLIEDGYVAEWRIPNADRYPESTRIGDYAYTTMMTDVVIVYNVNKVTPEEVELLRNWKGILDPRFKGRFSVTSMKCGICYAPIHMFLDDKYKDTFGEEFLEQVAAQEPAVYRDVLIGLDRVIAGEQDINFWSWEGAALGKIEQGAPIRWVAPEIAPSFSSSYQGISKYAPHPNAARLFQDWTMSEEGAIAGERLYGSRAAMDGLADTRNVAKQDWYQPAKVTYSVDYDRWNENFEDDMDTWTQLLKGAQ